MMYWKLSKNEFKYALFSGYTKQEGKHCWNSKYGNYPSLEEAQSACSADSNCQGVYDLWCDTLDSYYLCPAKKSSGDAFELKPSGSSCVYTKGKSNFR